MAKWQIQPQPITNQPREIPVYEQSFSRSAPGCIVFLIDRSDSMQQKWTSSGTTLAEGAARAINKILLELCVKATKETVG